jgi:hypothetical protein
VTAKDLSPNVCSACISHNIERNLAAIYWIKHLICREFCGYLHCLELVARISFPIRVDLEISIARETSTLPIREMALD